MSSVRRQVVVRADVPWSNSSVDDQGIDTATERLPQTPAGEALEKIVLEVLGDDRLDRGGKTSHFGVEVRSRIEAAFGVELSPEEILGAGSTGALLGLVERALASSFSDMFGDAPLTESSFLEVAVVEPIPQISREGQLVTSFGQQRLWLIEQLRPGTSEYVVPVAIRFTGPFRIDLLERALETVAARHEVLRTRIVTYDGVPVQRIDSVVRLDLKPVRCPLGEVREFIRQGTNQSFDLEKDQLFRVQLFDIGRDGFVLAFYFHHAIFDNWSAGVLVKELEASYEALSSGKPLLLPDLPVQYSDFAAWQRQETTGNALETELRFWRGQLDGLAPLEMPTDHPRPDRWDPIGNVLTIEVPSALVDSVLSLGSSHGATPFVSFLSAFQVMLARYGQTDDISVGVPVAGRTRSETEDLIGFFANTVVVRSVVKNELAFTSFLQNVKQTVEAAIAHQDLPFERVVAEMSPDRDLSRNPLCQVMFVVQNSGATDQHFGLGEARGEFLHVGNEAAKFDISWTMQSLESGGFSVDIVYSERLFDRSSIEHMTHQYLQLLRSIVDTPEEQLGKLRLVQPDDRSGSGQHPNFIAGSVSLSVVELFADSVARDPASVALIHGDEEMSYDELDRRSSKLAHHLRSVGVGPEVLVAVLLPRSAEVVVTWLAILKAGGAYVPLDPQHPTKRLSYVLEDTAAPVLITDTATRTHVPEY
ncbi:condensation domain-containing protein, partial [Glaciibacter superstes]|uniref:condensation domain-containing protein n=1 Tax=Glaciibacter superstes TaxID=501023 RepID=UPI0012F8994A